MKKIEESEKWLKKISKNINKCFQSDKFKFISYNLLLPLVIPLIILIFSVWINLDIISFDLKLKKSIIQTSSLFLIVTLFTNIGFWSSAKIQTDEAQNKEGDVASSLLLGVISVFLFVSSFMTITNQIAKILIGINLGFLVVSLILLSRNPLAVYSLPRIENGDDITQELEEDILNG